MAATFSLVDSHAHLYMPQFDEDRDEVIARALESGVSNIVNVGIDLDASARAIELARKHSRLMAAVGIHPHGAVGVVKADIYRLAELARQANVVAVGEIGLDFYRNRSPREAQILAFTWQLELASELKLPVIVHCRHADSELLRLLRGFADIGNIPGGKGVAHCFSGDADIASQYLDMGFFLSFGAYIGYAGRSHLCDLISSLPRERLLLETDSPFLPPQSKRGQRNEPAYLVEVARVLADVTGDSFHEIARQTSENACRLFNLPHTDS
jgi:TatD DNase family protein